MASSSATICSFPIYRQRRALDPDDAEVAPFFCESSVPNRPRRPAVSRAGPGFSGPASQPGAWQMGADPSFRSLLWAFPSINEAGLGERPMVTPAAPCLPPSFWWSAVCFPMELVNRTPFRHISHPVSVPPPRIRAPIAWEPRYLLFFFTWCAFPSLCASLRAAGILMPP